MGEKDGNWRPETVGPIAYFAAVSARYHPWLVDLVCIKNPCGFRCAKLAAELNGLIASARRRITARICE
jgi:hypothetical protein